MPALHENLRKQLEKVIIEARDVAEAAARSALQRLAVDQPELFKHQSPDQRQLRNQLRARARQLGDLLEQKKQAIDHLAHELAYEHWHRMLFARFLAENNLLIHPDLAVPVTLAECEDLAKEEAAGTKQKPDPWALAGRFASKMLPQIFRTDDPLLQVTFAPEDQQALEKLLVSLPGGQHGVFTADDSLGWVYQFWQTNEKDRVNSSGEKITGDTLPAVTQLFTEHYMVQFLLHNTIGAWHAGKVLAAKPDLAQTAKDEAELRKAVALDGYKFDYLRFIRTDDGKGPWRPAAGTFDGWPKVARQLKVLDPCCGSGHFLTSTFDLLIRLRQAEEDLPLADAVSIVLSNNLHGLELDLRCTQIAAFNLALAAWKLTGHRSLPPLNIACTGIGPRAKKEEWLKLADAESSRHREPIRFGLGLLHDAFAHAPTLGSLIDPKAVTGTLGAADFESMAPALAAALAAETSDDVHADAITAQGLLKAAELLGGPEAGYTLVITNVPYLGRGKQDPILQAWAEENEPDAKADLATIFISRSLKWLGRGGTVAVVSPQNWLFLTTYKRLRERLLRDRQWEVVARLGSGAFETIGGAVVNVALLALTCAEAAEDHAILGLDASLGKSTTEKDAFLRGLGGGVSGASAPRQLSQAGQLQNPDYRFTDALNTGTPLLSSYAKTGTGMQTFDLPRFLFSMWEVPLFQTIWLPSQSTVDDTCKYGGVSEIVRWEDGKGELYAYMQQLAAQGYTSGIWKAGSQFWGRSGVVISLMNDLPCTLYLGIPFNQNTGVLIPKDDKHTAAIWCFCEAGNLSTAVRAIDQSLKVTNGTVSKVPFDLAHWQAVAAAKYPNGLPKPESDDPTQWLFHGRPEESGQPLQVSVARLAGYRWPAELDDEMRLSTRARKLAKQCDELLKHADADGILCIPSVRGEEPAADRLKAILHACGLNPDRDLDDWLRNDFFEEHFKLFHHRPFVWHIWDGRKKDGFHALVNYHKLADGKRGKKLLDTLTYTYLGDWINRQKADAKAEKTGADARLAAALELQSKLEAIIAGEPPYDIFVRWKPLHEQPIGWEPNINEGVRMNIRPFIEANILRKTPNIKWTKDRGKDPESAPWFRKFKGERINDHHLTNAEKQAARDAHAKTKGKV